MEAKPVFSGKTSTAFLDDYDKLTTTLGHMMARLVQSVNTVDVKRLEVVGLMLAGLHYQAIRMWTPNGNVFVAKPDVLYNIPTDVKYLRNLVPLLFSVWQMMVSYPILFSDGTIRSLTPGGSFLYIENDGGLLGDCQ